MSGLREMMGEIELQRRRGNFKGSENLIKLEMKQAETENNDPYFHFYGGLLLYYFNRLKDAILNLNNALLTQDHDMFYVEKYKGIVHLDMGEHEQARDHLEKAMAIAKKANDTDWITSIETCMGNMHTRTGQFKQALEMYRKALDTAVNSKNEEWIETAACNVGVAHSNLGDYAGLDPVLRGLISPRRGPERHTRKARMPE